MAASDTNTRGPITPNWEISQVTVAQIPEPASTVLVALAAGMAGFSVTRRRGML
jgi:hypothetical protein